MRGSSAIVVACLLPAAALAQKPEQREELPQQVVMTAEEAYELGLLDEPLPKLVIPLGEVESKEKLMERIGEHLDGIEHVNLLPLHIPPDAARVLEAIESGDDDQLRETLSDLAGAEVGLPTADQRRQHDEAARYEPERYNTTEETLARMTPERVEALADHRHLLDEEWRLVEALAEGDMDGLARSAAQEFLVKKHKEDEPLMPVELEDQILQAQERGWYEVDFPAPGRGLLRDAEHLEASKSSLSTYDEFIPGTADSYSIDLPGSARMDVVSDTKFGGVLYSEKTEAVNVRPHDPNLHILGHDATVTTSKFVDDVWATTVVAFDGSYMYRVTLEKKLEGEELDEFVRMATVMIEEDLSR